MNIQLPLIIIIVLLVWILLKLFSISARLKERFPTEKEEDYKWSQDDPMGHWEAHKKERLQGKEDNPQDAKKEHRR
jgi:hypothetical protein